MGLFDDFGNTDDTYDGNTSYDPGPQAVAQGEDDVIDQAAADQHAMTDFSAKSRYSGGIKLDPATAAAIIYHAEQNGWDPYDMAKVISYETGGTFNPRILGPMTKNQGQGIGLSQFMSEGSAKDYGVTPDTPGPEQIAAMAQYLKDRGFKQGMGLLDMYSTVNAGRPGRYTASDANNGGAPGNVADKVKVIEREHAANAMKFLSAAEGFDPSKYLAGGYGARGGTDLSALKRNPITFGTGTIDNATGMENGPQADFLDVPSMPSTPNPGIKPIRFAAYSVPPIPDEPVPQVLDDNKGIGNISSDISVDNVTTQQQAPPTFDKIQSIQGDPGDAFSALGDSSKLLNIQGAIEEANRAAAAQAPQVPEQLPTQPTEENLSPPPKPSTRPTPPVPSNPGSALRDAVMGVSNDVSQGARQFGSKALGLVTATPVDMAAGLAALADQNQGPDGLAHYLHNKAEQARAASDVAFGVPNIGETPFQKASALAGRNLTTLGGMTVLPTVLMSAADLASQGVFNFVSYANAKPTMTKQEAQDILAPDEVKQKIADLVNQNSPGPRVTHIIRTAGGDAKVPDDSLQAMTIMGAVTLGMMFAPGVVKRIADTPFGSRLLAATERAVEHAPQGVLAFSSRKDYMRMADDKYAGILGTAERIGMNPQVLDNLRDNFSINTGGSAHSLIDAAINTGEMLTPHFKMQTRVPLAELAARETPEATRYQLLRHTVGEIDAAEQKLANMPQAAQQQAATAGPIRVRGLTKADALSQINVLEKTNPEVVQFSKDYRDIVDNVRRFEGRGEYATKSKDQVRMANRDEVFQDLALGNTQTDVIPVTHSLEREMRGAMIRRMESEATGQFLDQTRRLRAEFSQIVDAQTLKDNSNWQQNSFTQMRRGVKEIHVTDPFVAGTLNMDPWAPYGTLGQIAYASKRMAEATATGVLAPFFALTSMIRNNRLGVMTNLHGTPSPSILGTVTAVPKQLYPPMAKYMAERLDAHSGGWLGKVFGQQTLQGLSGMLAQAFDQSTLAHLSKGGSHQSSFLQHQSEAPFKLVTTLRDMTPSPVRDILTAYKGTLNAIHNAANFDVASKMVKKGVNPTEANLAARRLTGDNTRGGSIFTRDGGNPFARPSMVRFQEHGKLLNVTVPRFVSHTATDAAKLYAGLTEIGRNASPWWNITTQGMKQVAKAYWENPVAFMSKMYLYQQIPVAAMFMYNRGLGKDPNGVSYSDYQMNGRSAYTKTMNQYIGIPGRSVADGIELPIRYHEGAIATHMLEIALNHLTQSEKFGNAEDFLKAAANLLHVNYNPDYSRPQVVMPFMQDAKNALTTAGEIAAFPAPPPAVNALLGSVGVVAPQGPFAGGSYTKRQDPYDKFNTMTPALELVARAFATGTADILGEGLNAYTRSNDTMNGAANFASAAAKRTVEKTPLLRDATNIHIPQSGNTDITKEMYRYKSTIDNMLKFYKQEDPDYESETAQKRDLKSKEGSAIAHNFLGASPPKDTLGMEYPEPTNPLYKAFIGELNTLFSKDTETERGKGKIYSGGIGFPSHMVLYGKLTDQLTDMRRVNDGNMVDWQERIYNNPELQNYLDENNVDSRNPKAVRNFLEQRRQDVARQIVYTIQALENQYRERLGNPNFKFSDLEPYSNQTIPAQVGPSFLKSGPVVK